MSKFLQSESEGSDQESQNQGSKFLQIKEENEIEEKGAQEIKESKNVKQETKKNKNKKDDSDDELDKLLAQKATQEQELDEEAKKKAEKKKEKKAKQAEKKKNQPEQQQQQQQAQVPEKKPEKPGKKPNAAALKALEMQKIKEEEQRRIREEEERLRREEEERIRQEKEEEERRKKEQEDKAAEKKRKKEELIKKGVFKTKKQLEEEEKIKFMREQLGIKLEDAGNTSNVVKKNKKKPGQQNNQAEPTVQKQTETIQPEQKVEEKQQEKQPEKQQQVAKQIQQQPQQQQQSKEEVITQKNEAEEIESWEQFVEEGEAEQLQQEKEKQEKQQVEAQKKQQEQQNQQQSYSSTTKKEILDLYKPVGELRSPICCILGHVDTGKTTLLDKIRNTNVQEGEAGGITQQIGATFFPAKKLKEELIKTQQFYQVDCNIPGLLIIDTPGHESFSNLRTRGSSLCDLAILVIDLMHGLENQTLESLELLKIRKTPFIIALNKIDRCVEWKNKKNASSYHQLQNQTKNCKMDYETKRQQVVTQLAEKGFNVAFYWENEDPKTYISVVPTSGVTGEGIPDLLSVIVKYTSVYMKNKIKVKEQFNCTVLEKKVTEGHGTTIDCLLIDGQIKKDDKIILAGFQGPIVTKVRALLTPHPMKEMRVKGEYIHHDVIYASMGLKISAVGLEDAMAGSQMYLANSQDDIDKATQIINNEMEEVKKYIKLQNQGVGVAASTLGSLEALLQYLNSQEIPVSYVSVGPVSKDDVMKALKNVLLEDVNRRKKEYACMLVFDVKILPDAQKFAEENQIKIFEANIIYHLFTKFTEFIKQVKEERKKKEAADVVFPSLLKIVRIINAKEPLILGVEVEQGILKTGTPICIYDQNSNKNKIGIVETIELNHKSLKEARATTGAVALRIGTNQAIQAGKQITLETKLASLITRRAIDILKEHYREELTLDDWQLVKDLKLFLNIG
ncbi:unnamed protein product [Paramecium primaurelia]|uniref:Eukaryotic translation initiation factor 5B n=1 Tax=Paramecium primaurelia TaxID=5886 RepID=A0A8S1PT62_PARPR|nr:unnamed protein product [Paramecium primaurelia]